MTYSFISCFCFCTSESFVICRRFIFVMVTNIHFHKREAHTPNLEVYLIMSYMLSSKNNLQVKKPLMESFFQCSQTTCIIIKREKKVEATYFCLPDLHFYIIRLLSREMQEQNLKVYSSWYSLFNTGARRNLFFFFS